MSSVDFAILTGLKEEFSMLLKLLPNSVEIGEGSDVWYRTRLEGPKGKTYEVVLSYATAMGPPYAQSLTRKVIAKWDPAYLILVGIAARFDNEIRLGDVLVSQQIFYYDPAKAAASGLKIRPEGYPCSQTLIRQAEALSMDAEDAQLWRIEAKKTAALVADNLRDNPPLPNEAGIPFDLDAAEKELRAHDPKVYFGTVASGSLVIDSPEKKKELLSSHGKIIGAEMEGAGMMIAVWDEEMPPAAVVIKGVSDYADGNKAQDDAKKYWRRLATENSFRMAVDLIRRGRIKALNADRFHLEPSKGSAAEARAVLGTKSVGAANLAFPRLVVPHGPLSELRIKFEVLGSGGELLGISDGRVRYFDRAGKPVQEDLSGNRQSWSIEWPMSPIGPGPIGLYLVVQGTPQQANFSAAIYNRGPEQATWSVKDEE
jgi:nucleoside phosphorylase